MRVSTSERRRTPLLNSFERRGLEIENGGTRSINIEARRGHGILNLTRLLGEAIRKRTSHGRRTRMRTSRFIR